MHRTWIVVVMALLVGCGDGSDAPATFDGELPGFIESICQVGVQCYQDDLEACRADVTADMADARAALDAAGEAQCARCMRTTSELGDALVAADCDNDAIDPSGVLADCDLDPNVDYLDDGFPDSDEACAGYP